MPRPAPVPRTETYEFRQWAEQRHRGFQAAHLRLGNL